MKGAPPALRARLFQLVAAAVLPLVLLVAGVVLAGYITNRKQAAQQAQSMARGIALAVEGELRAHIAATEVLAESSHLAAGDLGAFRAQAEAVRARLDPGANITLLREDGQQVMNLAVPPGAPLPVRPDAESVRRVFATGKPSVSDAFFGAVLHRPTVAVDVPIRRADGSVSVVLSTDLPLRPFDEAVRRQHLPPGWVAAVLDRKGTIVARTHSPERFVGTPTSASFRPLLFSRDEGIAEVTTLEGTSVLTAWSRPGPSGWCVGVGIPVAEFYAPLWRTLGITLAISALALLAALALASLVAARIAGPIRALANLAGLEGTSVQAPPSLGLREADATAASLFGALRERGQAEAARAKRDAELREAQRVAHIGSWHWDAATDATTGSDELLRIYGLDPATEDMPAFHEQRGQLYPADSWVRLNDAVQRALETGVGYELDVEAFSGGRPIWITMRCEVVRDPGGRVVGLRGTVQDITQRKRAEEALAESEARYRVLATATQEGVVLHDGERIVEVNDAYWRMFGFASREDVIGRSPFELVVPDLRDDALGKVTAQHAEPYETVGLRRDGSTFPFTANGRTVAYQGRRMRVTVLRDLTRQKVAAAALRESEERFRAAVRAVSGIVWTNNAAGEMAGEQPGWAALTGQSLEEYQGYGWAKAVHPEDAQPTVDAWNASVAERRTFVFEHRVRRHDGVWRRFAIRAIPALREDGTIREWVGVHTDVTEQREAEAALAELNRHLEERVRAEVAARESAQERAKHAQHMQALGQIAGGVAHEFNNLLQAVQGAVRLVESRAADPASVRKFAGIALKSSERGSNITYRLLSFAQRSSFCPEQIEPAAMLDAIRDVLAHTLGGRVAVRLELQPLLPAVTADKADLQTALVNLAANARDAMPDGGALTLAAVTDTVEAEWSRPTPLKPGRYIRFVVSDGGTGMDEATLARAAEPFFTTKPFGSGTGLGLSMAKGFAEQSGGGLAIESAPGHGTTVTLWLPVTDGDNGMAGRHHAARERVTSAKLATRVLLVDDEEMVRETLAVGLEDAGLAVLLAQSGAEALALLDAGEPVDVLVTDLSMPGMDGAELIRHAQERRPDLPALVLTGYVDTAAGGQAGAGGPCAVLHKPIAAARLAECLAEMLAAKPGRGESDFNT
ncbi:Histidine kinase (plasmid) [Rhodovastum atsumiense]|uniref:histidine kinase n=1 Tax=Rhodovastum atsumiense TaxID=504468 RepID=A0A5M6IKA4_9PROT|nr:PAS domain S-box protein [Rhodovastum atsumiense]KAA5608680.1 PAS domain S-box protein [Rhodovastum atsumiense]CAH2605918.1 Histidine kinase [Rhodovastum atsumiense]